MAMAVTMSITMVMNNHGTFNIEKAQMLNSK